MESEYKTCANDRCKKLFIKNPKARHQLFCCAKCRLAKFARDKRSMLSDEEKKQQKDRLTMIKNKKRLRRKVAPMKIQDWMYN